MQAARVREQHPLEVCLLCSYSQLAEGTVQHTPDVLGEVCVWCDVAPPQVIQELHNSTTAVHARSQNQEPCSMHKATRFMTCDDSLRHCCQTDLVKTAVKLLVWLKVKSGVAYLLYNAA